MNTNEFQNVRREATNLEGRAPLASRSRRNPREMGGAPSCLMILTMVCAIAWTLIVTLIFLGLCSGAVYGADKHAMTASDVVNIKSVSSPAISPDGKWVIYTVRAWEAASKDPAKPGKQEAKTHLWMVSATSPAGEGAPHQITFGETDETNAAWSPDGKRISFVAARGKGPAGAGGEAGDGPKQQIWLMRADGGEAWQLTESKESVGAYAWSSDGKQIAYVSREPLAKEVEEAHKRNDDPQVFEGDFTASAVSVIEVERKKTTAIVTGQTFTIQGDPSWSPDASQIAFSAKPTPLLRDNRADVYLVNVSTKAMEKITTEPGPDVSPHWSPDGTMIAYQSEPNKWKPLPDGTQNQDVSNQHLMIYNVASKKIEDHSTKEFDVSVGSPIWMPDSKRILFVSGKSVYYEVFSYDLATKKYAQLSHEKMIFARSNSGGLDRAASTITFTMSTPTEPAEVYVSDLSFASPRKLTDTNPQVRDFLLGSTEVIQWKSSDGMTIEGVLIKPAGYQAGKKYPFLVDVHGGPTGAHLNYFQAEGQMWAGNGWAVLFPNPRGSSNYGEKFARANIMDWGGGDYRDIMAGTDAVIARGIADPDHMAEEGWSYGGYMTCWIVSQTGRFKAAMMGAGLSNLVSMYGTTDIPSYLLTFFEGYPTKDNTRLYNERSGLTYVDQVTTPLLILQGGRDERVPTSQSMEFFRALKDRGKTVELVYYPREGHGLGEYYHQYDRYRRTYEWITKYTLGAGKDTKTAGQ